MSIESILQDYDVTENEIELWSGARRPSGRPTTAMQESFARRAEIIVALAKRASKTFSQSIRHIYYLASGLKLTGKDHGDSTYWYGVVSEAINDARWAGTLPWSCIADETRSFYVPVFWNDAVDFLKSIEHGFVADKWKDQDARVVLCVEKDAIRSMLEDVAGELHVPLMSFHGQASNGGCINELAKHITSLKGRCKRVEVAYLGDWDAAGKIIDKVALGGDKLAERPANADDDDNFDRDAYREYLGKKHGKLFRLLLDDDDVPLVSYERIGVTKDDVENPDYAAYLLPANPDTNYERFVRDTSEGSDGADFFICRNCFEPVMWMEQWIASKKKKAAICLGCGEPHNNTLGIDALSHETLVSRVRDFVEQFIDKNAWSKQEAEQEAQRAEISRRINGNGNVNRKAARRLKKKVNN